MRKKSVLCVAALTSLTALVAPVAQASEPALSSGSSLSSGQQSDVQAEREHLHKALGSIYARLLLAEKVAEAKFFDGSPVDNPEQEARVIASLRKTAEEVGLDPDYVEVVFRDIFEAMKALQYQYLDQWKADPMSAPTEPSGDLEQVRLELSALSKTIVTELAQAGSLIEGPSCGVALNEVRAQVLLEHPLDLQIALQFFKATEDVCH